MGVMSCHRKGCDEIMCQTYVNTVGYICYGCRTEFEFFVGAKKKVRTEERLLKWLKEFMQIEPNRNYNNSVDEGITVYDFFQKYAID